MRPIILMALCLCMSCATNVDVGKVGRYDLEKPFLSLYIYNSLNVLSIFEDETVMIQWARSEIAIPVFRYYLMTRYGVHDPVPMLDIYIKKIYNSTTDYNSTLDIIFKDPLDRKFENSDEIQSTGVSGFRFKSKESYDKVSDEFYNFIKEFNLDDELFIDEYRKHILNKRSLGDIYIE